MAGQTGYLRADGLALVEQTGLPSFSDVAASKPKECHTQAGGMFAWALRDAAGDAGCHQFNFPVIVQSRTLRGFPDPPATTPLGKAQLRPRAAVAVAAAVLAMHVPIASQQRFLNRLTQARESATAWRFFDSLHERRILIVTDRPNLFTIMDYGAMSFESARQDPYLFEAFARHLFYDIYVVQQIKLSTGSPLAGYDIWPQRRFETVLEYQNDADVLIRISRLEH